jgi:hypothetical protein
MVRSEVRKERMWSVRRLKIWQWVLTAGEQNRANI